MNYKIIFTSGMIGVIILWIVFSQINSRKLISCFITLSTHFRINCSDERTALCLLAILNLSEEKDWSNAENPLIGLTPIMHFAKVFFVNEYAPNSRETFKKVQFINYYQ